MKLVFSILTLFISGAAFSQSVETYTYAIKNKDSLKLDVYTPKDIVPGAKLPVVIWMHGGGFSGGSRDGANEQQLMKYATNNGFIGVSISYRLLHKGAKTGFGCQCDTQDKLFTFANAAEDFLDATNYIIEYSDSLHIDSTTIIAAGSSAGAEAVLSAVYMKDYFIEDTTRYQSIRYAGLISFSGALVDEHYITKDNAIPTVLFHGTKDTIVPYSKAAHHFCNPNDKGYLILNGPDLIYKRLEELEASYYLFRVDGGQHEVSSPQWLEMDTVFEFITNTVLHAKVIQTKRITHKD